jgi:uncharacterized protein YndB with AHSA1/START domain
MDTPFEIEYTYDAPIGKVWQALTSEGEMREWYFPQLIHFETKPGFEFEFRDDGSPYQKNWTVTKVVDGKLLAHNWSYKDYPGSSEVTFELFDMGEQTRLKLTHTGIGSFPDDMHFARHRFEDGWKNILGHNLKEHLSSNKIN